MNKKRVTAEPSSELRLLAEQRLRDKLSIDPDALTSPQDMRRIIHELSVHQLELEMQQEELMHSRAELESSLDRYTSLYDFSPLGYLTISNKGKIIHANLTSSRMLGVDRSLLINKPFRHFIAPEYIPVYSALMESLFKLKAPGCCEIVLLSAEGIPAAEAQTPPQGHNIRVEAVHLSKSDECQLILSDITELQKRSRALQAINNCNQALLHAQSEEELLQEICTIIVETGGYRMTWVGYALDDEEKSVLPVAKAGYDAGYLETLKVSWGDNEHGQGPGGSAVRTGRPFTTRNMQADPRFAPWRKEALARGYVSSLGLPMKSDDHVFGVLNIYSSMVDAFTEEEIALLASLTDNLAYGITMLRTRKHRDEAENEIRQSEARYKTLFQNKYIIMLIIDPESGRIIDANPAAVTFYGWEHDELCRMNISEINMLSEAEIKAEMQRARRDERNYFIFRHRRSDGSIRDVEVFSGPIILQGKSLLYSIIHDFTERKHLQEQLVANSERMNFILASTNSGVWETIMETNDAVWSDKMWALLGLKPNSCKPSFDNWLKTVIAEDRKTVEAAAAEALLKGVEFDCMWRTRDEDGSIRWLMSKGAPVRDADSRIVRYAGIVLDITERKKEEEEKNMLEARLRKSQRLETIGTLAGGIAHDFNNLLTPILGYAEMGVMSLSSEEPMHDYFNEIMLAAERARHLVSQILTFSKSQESTTAIVSVQAVIEEALKLLRPSIPVTIRIEQHIEKNCRNILADSSKLHQVIVNLSTNAFQAMEASGGVLTIELREITLDNNTQRLFPKLDAKGCLQLTVSDTGTGMDEATMERIFEPFFTTKAVNKGTGLGLSVVHGIIKSFRGEIVVESLVGKGTSFKIYLPLVDEKSEKREAKSAHAKGHGTILLVDDEQAALKVMSLMITKLGFNVDALNSPQQALEEFRRQPEQFDLLITDLTMPEMTGFELAEEIHKTDPKLPIIMISGYGKNVHDLSTINRVGITRTLNKPVQMVQIASAIHEVLPVTLDPTP